MAHRIGFIGMVGPELKADLWGTLARMAELGYQGIEGGNVLIGATPAETAANRRRLEDLGLSVIALGASHYRIDQLGEAIDHALALGAGHLVDYWADPKNQDELKVLAEQLEGMAVRCREAGLRFCYHNHDHEFREGFGDKGKRTFFDALFAATEALCFEIDIAWAHFGGVDPVGLLRRCGHRVPVIHVKDLSDDRQRGHFTAVGTGKVPCFAAMEAAAAKGVEWMVVEQDSPNRLSAFESAVASIYNIREAGLHPSR